jgi:hypothetical protein
MGMQRVYANQFLVDPENRPPKEVLYAIGQDVKSWVQGSHMKRFKSPLDWPQTTQVDHPETHARVKADLQEGQDAAVLDVDYMHPDPDDPEREWEIRIRIAWAGDKIEFFLESFTGYQGRIVRPESTKVDQPQIIQTVCRKYPCYASRERIVQNYRWISKTQVSSFVEKTLKDPARSVPVVVIAPHVEMGRKGYRYVTHPKVLSGRLLGLAHVYVLRDFDAGETLESLLGNLSVRPTGLRIYYPGFTEDDDPHAHPEYTERLFKEIGVTKPETKRRILEKEVYEIAGQTLVRGKTSREALRMIGKEQIEAARRSSSIDEIRSRLEDLQTRYNGLESENEQLTDQVNRLETELSKTKRKEGRPLDSIAFLHDYQRTKTLKETLEFLEPHLPNLRFEKEAHKNIQEARIGPNQRNKSQLFLVLRALNDLAQDYHSLDPEPRSLGMPLDEWINQRSKQYGEKIPRMRNHESESTRAMYGEQRMFSFNGQTRLYSRHTTLSEGHSDCIQVYWEYAEDEPMIHIGYIGPHLEYATQV